MFRPLPNPAPDGTGPTHIINGNVTAPGKCRQDAFYVGRHNTETEKFEIDMKIGPQMLENGCGDGGFPSGRSSWAVAGPAGDGRLLTVDWLSYHACGRFGGCGANVASLVRELLFDHAAQRLLMRPVAEYALLHNATFVKDATKVLAPAEPAKGAVGGSGSNGGSAGSLVTLNVPKDKGGAIDVEVSFDVERTAQPRMQQQQQQQQHEGTEQQQQEAFGIAVRAPAGSIEGAAVQVSFNVSAPDPTTGTRTVTAYGVRAQVPPFPVLKGETLDVRLLVDRAIVEVFLMGGRTSFVASKVAYDPEATAVHLFNNGAAEVVAKGISVFGMVCGWTDVLPLPKQALHV